jgi:hypothetical protein
MDAVGGPKNRRESPNTRTQDQRDSTCNSRKTGRQKNLQKTALALKVVNPFTRAHAPPFIGRRRDFLHSETTLESREYSWCEHVHECLLHPMIYEANFIYLQDCH